MQNLIGKLKNIGKKDAVKSKEEEEEERRRELEIQSRLREFDKYDEKNYSILFTKLEKECKHEAIFSTKEEIEKQIEILVGVKSTWCTFSEEVKHFERNMKKIYRQNDAKLKLNVDYDGKVNLQRYLSNEPTPKSDREKIKFVCGVNIDSCEQFEQPIFQAISCDAFKTADKFLDEIIFKANHLKKENAKEFRARDWVLKVSGSNDYIYGSVDLYKFQAIRRALKYGKPYIELNLMSKKIEERKLDKYAKKLEKMDYDVLFKVAKGKRPVNNDTVKISKFKNRLVEMRCLSVRNVKSKFSILLQNFQCLIPPFDLFKKKLKHHVIFVHLELKQGSFLIGETYSKAIQFHVNASWNQRMYFYAPGPCVGMTSKDPVFTKIFPRETVVVITVYGRKRSWQDPALYNDTGSGEVKEKDFPIGSTSFSVFDFKNVLKVGMMNFKLNVGARGNLWGFGEGDGSLLLSIKLEEYCLPVVFPEIETFTEEDKKLLSHYEATLSYKFSIFKGKQLKEELRNLIKDTPIAQLTEKQKWILWKSKENITGEFDLLPKFLLSVPWNIPIAVKKCHDLLRRWRKPPKPIRVLEFFSYVYPDKTVRDYAIEQLYKLGNSEIIQYMLQLCQALKFELYHDTALARFLIERAFSSFDIANYFFWYLKSEMHIAVIRERFGLLLEEYLKHCAGFRIELLKQNCVLEQIYKIALDIKKFKGKKETVINKNLKDYLKQLKLPRVFKLPLSSRIELSGVDIEKSKIMTSAKLPLFLHFKNTDKFAKEDFVVLYKAGDDLRQDVLTLQILKIMDTLLKQNQMDLHLRCYGCITTGDLQGMIEIVQRSKTIADIAFDKGIRNMLSKDAFLIWLKKKNTKGNYEDMKINFLKSSAGYCVASYVLGLGDRHNDNSKLSFFSYLTSQLVMLSENGDLFHIDFGHFLGHKKYFLGVKRETTPFVFTQMYASVLGGQDSEKFKEFERLTKKAFNILRGETNFLM